MFVEARVVGIEQRIGIGATQQQGLAAGAEVAFCLSLGEIPVTHGGVTIEHDAFEPAMAQQQAVIVAVIAEDIVVRPPRAR